MIRVETYTDLATKFMALTAAAPPGSQWTTVIRQGQVGFERNTERGPLRLEVAEQFKE